MRKRWIILFLTVGTLAAGLAIGVGAEPDSAPLAAPITSAFNYQGFLEDAGLAANGLYDMRFSLWNDASVGSLVGGPITKANVSVVNGYFTVSLDFGAIYDGTALWLGIEVQGPGDSGYTTLSPRDAIHAVPEAVNADRLDGLDASAFASLIHNHLGEVWNTAIHDVGLSVGTYSTIGRGLKGVAYATTGSAYGVYGESSSVSGAGVYGVNNGGPGPLAFGVLGVSNADDGQGVHGEGRVGVSGWSFDSPGAGVTGSAYSATGSTRGVSGYSDSTTGAGVRGEATSDSGTNYGVIGTTDSSAGYDFYAGGAGVDYGPFTGAHEVKLEAAFPMEFKAGLVVSATGVAQVRLGPDGTVELSSTLPTVALSRVEKDPAVLGVLVSEITLPEDHWYGATAGERFATVNALGEGRVWVTDSGGDIAAGDYLTTSPLPGYGQRQADDLLHNYTLGKAVESIDWDAVTETIEYEGHHYKVYLLAVVYTSG